jgi:hypothetical protein
MAVRINFTAKLSYVFESALRNSGLWPKWASGQVRASSSDDGALCNTYQDVTEYRVGYKEYLS